MKISSGWRLSEKDQKTNHFVGLGFSSVPENFTEDEIQKIKDCELSKDKECSDKSTEIGKLYRRYNRELAKNVLVFGVGRPKGGKNADI